MWCLLKGIGQIRASAVQGVVFSTPPMVAVGDVVDPSVQGYDSSRSVFAVAVREFLLGEFPHRSERQLTCWQQAQGVARASRGLPLAGCEPIVGTWTRTGTSGHDGGSGQMGPHLGIRRTTTRAGFPR